MAASLVPFPVATNNISTAERHPVSRLVKTKLTISGHSQDAGEEITLAPRLHFTSFQALKAQTEALLRSLPGAKESSLVSLQYRDAEGDMIDLLESTFDPEDFRGASRMVLRAKVHLAKQQSPSPTPQLVAPPAKKKMLLAERKKTAPRRVLGRRDPNTLYAAPPLSAAAAGTAAGRNVAKKKSSALKMKITPRGFPAAAGGTATAAAATPTAVRSSNSVTTTMPTAKEGDKAVARNHQHNKQLLVPSSSRAGRGGGGRAPEFVFGAGESSKAPGSRDGTGAKVPRGRGRLAAAATATADPGSRRRQRVTTGAASSSSRKPSWNNGNEPAWEEVRLAPRASSAVGTIGKRRVRACTHLKRGRHERTINTTACRLCRYTCIIPGTSYSYPVSYLVPRSIRCSPLLTTLVRAVVQYVLVLVSYRQQYTPAVVVELQQCSSARPSAFGTSFVYTSITSACISCTSTRVYEYAVPCTRF